MVKGFKLLILLFIFISTPLLANVVLPPLYIWLGVSSVSILVTVVGILLELLCVCIMVRARTVALFGEAFFCTFMMNLFSAIIGIVVRFPLFAVVGLWGFIISPSFVENWEKIGVFGSINLLDIYVGFNLLLIYTLVNTLLEAIVASFFFPKIARLRFWFWIMMANLLSNGFGIICLGIYKLYYGSFPPGSW